MLKSQTAILYLLCDKSPTVFSLCSLFFHLTSLFSLLTVTAVLFYKSKAKADCDCIDMQCCPCCPCLIRCLHFLAFIYLFRLSTVDQASSPTVANRQLYNLNAISAKSGHSTLRLSALQSGIRGTFQATFHFHWPFNCTSLP